MGSSDREPCSCRWKRNYPDENIRQSRCLGLIGGLGVGATVHYYVELAKAHEAAGILLQLVMAHADVKRVLSHVQAGEPDHLARYLADLIARLKAAGAEIAAIPAVTPHIFVGELVAASPLPLVNLIESVGKEIHARNFHRLALFGTRFTIEARVFGQLPGVELMTPNAAEVVFTSAYCIDYGYHDSEVIGYSIWRGLRRLYRYF